MIGAGLLPVGGAGTLITTIWLSESYNKESTENGPSSILRLLVLAGLSPNLSKWPRRNAKRFEEIFEEI